MEWRYVLAAAFIFAVISVIATRNLINNDGYWGYIDYTPRYDLTSFREYFFTMFKWDGGIDLDNQKRIVLEWVYLFVDERQEQLVRFTAMAFCTLFFAYIVCLSLLEKEGHGGSARIHIISFTCGFLYLFNPIAISLFTEAYFLHSYAIFPLISYATYMTLESGRLKYPVMLGALTAFAFLVMVHNILFMLFTAIAVFIALAAVHRSRVWLEGVVSRSVLAAAVFALLTAFIMLPVAYITYESGLPQPGYVTSEEYVGRLSANSMVLRILTLDSHLFPWEHLAYAYPLQNAYYPIMALLFGAAIIAAIIKPNRLGLAALACICVFVLLGKGINPPFGDIYQKIIFELPNIGWMFRGGHKFAYVIPFFFVIALANMLAGVKDRKLLGGACAAILLTQSAFAWPVWTGDFDGAIKKKPADEAFLGVVSILKNDSDYRAKAIWYSDFKEMAPMRIISAQKSDLMMWLLIDGGRSVNALARLDNILGIEYLVIDSHQNRIYYDISYAKKAIKNATGSFEQIYSNKSYFVFRLNNGTDLFQVPSGVIVDYGGFHSLIPVLRSENTTPAVVFADSSASASEALGYSDTVIFGPHENVMLSLDKSQVITFESTANSSWEIYKPPPKSPNVTMLRGDQWLYGEGVVISQVAEVDGTENSTRKEIINPTGSPCGQDFIQKEFLVPQDAEYKIFSRILLNPDGGGLHFGVDGNAPASVDTRSGSVGFEWVRIYDGHLDKGTHTLRVCKEEGFQAVNLAYYMIKGSGGEAYDDSRLYGKRIITVFEAETDFEEMNKSLVYKRAYSGGTAVSLRNNTKLSAEIHIYRSGDYRVGFAGKNVTAYIDGVPLKGGNIRLGTGTHSLEIRTKGTGVLDYALIESGEKAPGNNAAVISYERKDPSTYEVTVNSTGPYFMVFTEGYDPLWRASSGGIETAPVPVYSAVNGFYINKTGVHKVTVYYGPQPWHNAGLVISGLGYLGVFIYLAGDYLKNKTGNGRGIA